MAISVPLGGANLGASSPSVMSNAPQAPGLGTVLAAAAIQSQDPSRSMPEGQDRPRFPAHKLRKRLQGMLKGK
jgi:hypothetical protein